MLERAGIARPPELVLAVTGDDEDNLVISQIAKEGYGVAKAIARVNDPRNQQHFDLLGIKQTVCATTSILGLVEHEVPEHGLVRLLELPGGGPRRRRGADREATRRWRASASGASRSPRARGSSRSSATGATELVEPSTVLRPGRPGARDRRERLGARPAPARSSAPKSSASGSDAPVVPRRAARPPGRSRAGRAT